MLSIVIPTLNAEATLAPVLAALVPGAVEGLVREVIVADGGSADRTEEIADAAGCQWIAAPRGRGPQLRAGAAVARSDWLLFLHADTVLTPGWIGEADRFLAHPGAHERAAAFRFALDAEGWRPRALEAMVRLRCSLFGLPYGDQGLLVSRRLYDRLGGFAELPLMEDVEFVRRIGRGRLSMLPVRAVTSATRYDRDGYLKRPARNLMCLGLYFAGMSPQRIARLYA
ncbi:TIGR04283 family arsenosugar biosynthesis glycosyltransferase [Futiania mangrovi]|uniref:TIGR04283 family arsenosugar biosynthesis glycosyltransferase n=1 Tax=Futiania mangrovi TaxID=2959716 RepID=A0A9J6PND9_9PROT|nr:TIGR04283 family arsenosugar biosynthesis glycosyltransferase [Futiania mangrovii]MCP1337578.1 TIGR04283 family arsenosugar biosynthesis glycosyltransferase [Futiania mangrovii]